ncbi:hypothetical protein DITRI_Ditri06bG0024100 [Diplodiscus trichospermus]
MIDIECSLQPDSLSHPSHEHLLLFTDHRISQGYCSGCGGPARRFAFRCKERCLFNLCFECITQPLITWYKYDKHPLTLTYHDDSSSTQYYCDLCEKKRNPNKWFYHCSDCDNSVHLKCLLGDIPFIKLGSKFSSLKHPNILKCVKKIWDSPPCRACGKVCSGLAFECLNADCNLLFHFKCISDYLCYLQK